ncbi:MAG: hypothetical protein ABL921_02465 [Pirellula sp.]
MNKFAIHSIPLLVVVCAICGEGRSRAHDPPTDRRALGAIMLRFSNDGESIACSYHGAIWKLSRTQGTMTRLSKTGREFDIEPTWSHDGTKIAMIRSTNFQTGPLGLIDSQTGRSIPLPTEVIASSKLHFDETDQKVLGVFKQNNEQPRLSWYDIASGQITLAVDETAWPPNFTDVLNYRRFIYAASHDGNSMAVVAPADVPGEQSGNQGPQCNVWRVSLQGKAPEKLFSWPARIHELCWTKDDGSFIVATERGGVHHDLWEIPVGSLDLARKWTFAQADESSPDATADGRWLC